MCLDYEKNVKDSELPNMERLHNEVDKLKRVGFDLGSITGVGEGIFTVTVKMIHAYYCDAIISIPQDCSQSEKGMVRFSPCDWFLKSYEF